MPSLLDYLPGVPPQYWKAYAVLKGPQSPVVIPKNSTGVSILPTPIIEKRGVFINFSLEANSSSITLNLTLDDQELKADLTELYTSGFYGYYIANAPFLTQYDTTTNVYSVYFTMAQPYPFYRNVNLTVDNPTKSDITISGLEINAFILNRGFYKALADLIAGKDIT